MGDGKQDFAKFTGGKATQPSQTYKKKIRIKLCEALMSVLHRLISNVAYVLSTVSQNTKGNVKCFI